MELIHNETTKLKYGYAKRYKEETKEEAIERVYNATVNNPSFSFFLRNGKLFFEKPDGTEHLFLEAFTDDNWEDAEVVTSVQSLIIQAVFVDAIFDRFKITN